MSGIWRFLRDRVRRRTGADTSGCPSACCAGCQPRVAGGSDRFSRRDLLAKFGVALAGVAAVLAGIPLVGSFFAPVARTERIWHPVGEIDDFPVDETVKVEFIDPDPLPWAGPAARNAAWLRRIGEEEFTAFSIYCTHVGCPVSWRAGASLFICPCHGGVFDREGEVVAGPPEAPLGRLEVRLREQQVEILAAPVPVTGRTT